MAESSGWWKGLVPEINERIQVNQVGVSVRARIAGKSARVGTIFARVDDAMRLTWNEQPVEMTVRRRRWSRRACC